MSTINNLVIYSLLLGLTLISACKSSADLTTLANEVAPNNCRINGTIISIEDINSQNLNLAKVRIDNVVQAGFSFNSPIIKGDTIKIKFEFTLSKTSNDVFPNLNNQLPGMLIGDKFTADIEKIDLIQLDKKVDNFQYRVFTYDKINIGK
ncbi:MAG: hypothetical protein COW71_15610 [Ignavibacteriales bacterium CG18_big_fil_WC_8_21_14_2_50_31_20]|nr:MAG: hypothetical protein COW71_15610 [Ignavibacteriales bacterium CG18_big_fil_WC_8_21_14_2_50_31_20]